MCITLYCWKIALVYGRTDDFSTIFITNIFRSMVCYVRWVNALPHIRSIFIEAKQINGFFTHNNINHTWRLQAFCQTATRTNCTFLNVYREKCHFQLDPFKILVNFSQRTTIKPDSVDKQQNIQQSSEISSLFGLIAALGKSKCLNKFFLRSFVAKKKHCFLYYFIMVNLISYIIRIASLVTIALIQFSALNSSVPL